MESEDSNTETMKFLKERIVELEEDLEFYKSILKMRNSCIYNLHIKRFHSKQENRLLGQLHSCRANWKFEFQLYSCRCFKL